MSKFPMTDVVVQWLEYQEWEERPKLDEEERSSSTNFEFRLNEEHTLDVWMDVNEQASFFKFYCYFTDTQIPAGKVPEVLRWVNLVNLNTPVGGLEFSLEHRRLRYNAGMYFEATTFEINHITSFMEWGIKTLRERVPQMLAICFAGKSAEEALEI